MKSEWLDTQTSAILHGSDHPKIAPSLDADFSLVLLRWGGSHQLNARALSRIFAPEKQDTIDDVLDKPSPFVVESSLSYESASLGQFELVCADSVAVILRNDVAFDGELDYLDNLFRSLCRSEEFQRVTVTLSGIPSDERGRNFCDQFLNAVDVLPPLTFPAMRKKARIMQHWGGKIGAIVELASNG
jgi:hypothetical protein